MTCPHLISEQPVMEEEVAEKVALFLAGKQKFATKSSRNRYIERTMSTLYVIQGGIHEMSDPGMGMPQQKERMRRLLECMGNLAIEKELEQHVGAVRYERTPQRLFYRNGCYRTHRIDIPGVGRVNLINPRTTGEKFQSVTVINMEKNKDELGKIVYEIGKNGVSNRGIERMSKLITGKSASRSEVSRIRQNFDAENEEWNGRSYADHPMRFLMADAKWTKVRSAETGKVVWTIVMNLVGIDAEGRRTVLHSCPTSGETDENWDAFFRYVIHGLRLSPHHVDMVITDANHGLIRAVRKYFPCARWQYCQFHYHKGISELLPQGKKYEESRRTFRTMLNRVMYADNKAEARNAKNDIVAEFDGKEWARALRKMNKYFEAATEVLGYPSSVRSRLATTNVLERLHQELERRLKVVSSFPSDTSMMRFVIPILRAYDEKWREEDPYITGLPTSPWDILGGTQRNGSPAFHDPG